MSFNIRPKLLSLLLLGTLACVTGCAFWGSKQPGKTRRASSLVQYLYPDQTNRVEKVTVPVLNLPLKVGVAFVPQPTAKNKEYSYTTALGLSEEEKLALMKEVSGHFRQLPFVQSIELIPTGYLAPEGGFANVDQLRAMFGVDVIALISYDQMQFNEQNQLAFAYWTIVGAYLINAERNETRTLMDTAVFDIASRKLLFRAPGTSVIKGSAAAVNVDKRLREKGGEGFQQASTNLVANLQVQLEDFKRRIKETPEEVKVVHKPGYTGAGAAGISEMFIALALGMFAWSGLCRKRVA